MLHSQLQGLCNTGLFSAKRNVQQILWPQVAWAVALLVDGRSRVAGRDAVVDLHVERSGDESCLSRAGWCVPVQWSCIYSPSLTRTPLCPPARSPMRRICPWVVCTLVQLNEWSQALKGSLKNPQTYCCQKVRLGETVQNYVFCVHILVLCFLLLCFLTLLLKERFCWGKTKVIMIQQTIMAVSCKMRKSMTVVYLESWGVAGFQAQDA